MKISHLLSYILQLIAVVVIIILFIFDRPASVKYESPKVPVASEPVPFYPNNSGKE